MAPAKGAKKEKVFHPQSRKAAQVERAQLRKSKLSEAAAKKAKHTTSLIDKFVFFFHAIPEDEEVMTLDELHGLIKDVWLARHDVALAEEQKARRKGRPKSAKEMRLENIKLFESEEYRTGLEVPDLTHAPTVALYRRWDQKALEYIDLLRFIRISGENTSTVVLTRPGKHELLLKQPASEQMTVDA